MSENNMQTNTRNQTFKRRECFRNLRWMEKSFLTETDFFYCITFPYKESISVPIGIDSMINPS